MKQKNAIHTNPFIVILGIAQDGGVPHCGCKKSCCVHAWNNVSKRKHATSIGICDPQTHERWIIDATPDFKYQLHMLHTLSPIEKNTPVVNGILLTHGHSGHFLGLSCLEKAVMNTQNIPVFAMPKMKKLLTQNTPWKNLVTEKNICIRDLRHHKKTVLNKHISVIPFLVPHRGEYSETVGFFIQGPSKKIVYIPDIDTLDPFEPLRHFIERADFVFLDGTFFDDTELPERNIKEVPHPFIQQSIDRLMMFPWKKRQKISFIHLNHSNPTLIASSKQRAYIKKTGFHVANEGDIFPL